MWIWPVWRALEFLLTYLDPSSFQPSPGPASGYTASIDRGCFKGNLQCWLVAAFAHPSVCKELVKLLDAKGISVRLKVTNNPKTWMRKERTTARWASKSLLDIGRLWAFLQPSGIEAFLSMGRSPISYHRGQETDSCSNSKFTSFQNLIISPPEELTASISYYELDTWQIGPRGHYHDGVG